MSASAKRAIFIVATVVVLLVAAGATWQILRSRPSEGTFFAWIQDKTSEALTLTSLEKTSTKLPDGSLLLDYTAVVQNPVALYEKERTDTYLRQQLKLGSSEIAPLSADLSGTRGQRIRELAGVGEPPPDLTQLVILREVTPTKSTFTIKGRATARRSEGAWQFDDLGHAFVGASPSGQPRASFAGKSYLAGNTTDDDTIAKLVVAQKDYAAKIETARTQLVEEFKRDREKRLATFVAHLKVGSLWQGTAIPRQSGRAPIPITLELTEVRPGSSQFTALLRNDGGWSDARSFQGSWRADAEASALDLTLSSRGTSSIRNAGPLLEDGGNLSLSLKLDAEGRLSSSQSDTFEYALARVPDDQIEKLKTDLSAALTKALAATRSGALYHGTATSKQTQLPENVILRIARTDDASTTFTATLEAVGSNTWKRPLRGTLIANRYRAGDQTVRLETASRDRTRQAPATSVFGFSRDLALALTPTDDGLRGEDAEFNYELLPTTNEALAQAKATAAASEAAIRQLYPQIAGAYVKIDDTWTPLPRNNGKNIPRSSEGVKKLLGGIVGTVSKNKKSADVIFTGTTALPAIAANHGKIIYRGQLPILPQAAKINYPMIEAAPTAAQPDGTRKALFVTVGENLIGFGDARIPAKIEALAPDLYIIQFTEPLKPGTYALAPGNELYEFQVE